MMMMLMIIYPYGFSTQISEKFLFLEAVSPSHTLMSKNIISHTTLLHDPFNRNHTHFKAQFQEN